MVRVSHRGACPQRLQTVIACGSIRARECIVLNVDEHIWTLGWQEGMVQPHAQASYL